MMLQAWRAGWALPDRRSIYEWAVEHVKLGPAYTITGPFHVEVSRHLIEPFDALHDPAIRTVVACKPTRGGGTLLADVWLPSVIARDPGPFMWNMQSDKIASEHAETRIMPTLESCPPVAALFPADPDQKRKCEILFAHGMALFIQGNSVANLQSKGIRYQVNDEVWCWPQGRLRQAVARTADFAELQNSKVLITSQAGVEDDDLDLAWKSGDQREWNVPCLACGQLQIPKWNGRRPDGSRWGIVWDAAARREDGNWNIQRAIDSLRFDCFHCGHGHADSPLTRKEWNRLGQYAVTNPTARRDTASFRWNALIIRSWATLLESFLVAQQAFDRGAWELLQAWIQKEAVEPWRLSQGYEVGDTLQGGYEIQSEWADETHRFLTVDRQQDHFWVCVRAWSNKTGESRLLHFSKLLTWAEVREAQESLKVPDNRVLVDTGYDATDCYRACSKYGWVALKGEDQPDFPHHKNGKNFRRLYSEVRWVDPWEGTAQQSRRRIPLHRWSKPSIRAILCRLRDGKGAKWLAYPGVGEDYKRQIHGVRRQRAINKRTGREEWLWMESRDDHAFDCEAQQIVAAVMCRVIQTETNETATPPASGENVVPTPLDGNN